MVLKCIRPPTLPTDKVREVHIFDLDRTLALSNASLLFVDFLKGRGVVSQFQWLCCSFSYFIYLLRLSSLEVQMRSSFGRFFRGKSAPEVLELIPQFWQELLSKQMREDLCHHLYELQRRGQVTAIYSASCDFLVEWIARQMQVNFVLGSEVTISPMHNTFLDLGTIANGVVKARAVQRLRYRFPNASVYGYSDSIDDAPFLASVDYPFLVSPDSKLKKWAKKKTQAVTWTAL